MSKECDLTLEDIAHYCDVFYIGGTKVGALCGEAVVFPKPCHNRHFITIMKQRGGLLAKGRLLGIQFDTLFSDELYFEISKHAIQMAQLLKDAFSSKQYKFFINSPTNQIFIILENSKLEELSKQVNFSYWEKYDENHTIVRFATSWSTTKEEVEQLIQLL